jgi:peroxiredoxin
MENNSEFRGSDISGDIKVGRWVEDRLAALTPPPGWEPDAAMGLRRLRLGRESYSAWSGPRVWLGAAAVAVCMGVLAFPATRVLAQRCVRACLLETGLAETLRPNMEPTRDGARRPAPDFTLPDASGNSVRLSQFRGQVVILNFWATWCPPCKVEIPWFTEFQREYGDAGLVVLGISLDEAGWKSVRPYLEKESVNYRVMVGSGEFARNFAGVDSLPATLLIDKAGRIASMYKGLVEKKTYEEAVRILLQE